MGRDPDAFNFITRSFVLIAIVFAGVTLLGGLYDWVVGHIADMTVELLVAAASVLALFLYGRSRRTVLPGSLLFWSIAFAAFAYALSHRFDSHIVFMILTPLIGLLILPKPYVIYTLIAYQVFAGLLLYYGYRHYPDNTFVFSAAGMLNYLFVTLYLFSFWLVYHLMIQKTIEALRQSSREKSILLRELQHRVKNNFNLILAMLEMQQAVHTERGLDTFVEHFKKRIHSIVLTHEMLYERDNLAAIDLQEYLPELSRQIFAGQTSRENVGLTFAIAPLTVPIDTLIYFGIMLNEMITNSLKHGLIKSGGHIRIALTPLGRSRYRFDYSDTGHCTDGALFDRQGFGHRVIGLTVQQIKGELETECRDGFHHRVTFDAESLA